MCFNLFGSNNGHLSPLPCLRKEKLQLAKASFRDLWSHGGSILTHSQMLRRMTWVWVKRGKKKKTAFLLASLQTNVKLAPSKTAHWGGFSKSWSLKMLGVSFWCPFTPFAQQLIGGVHYFEKHRFVREGKPKQTKTNLPLPERQGFWPLKSSSLLNRILFQGRCVAVTSRKQEVKRGSEMHSYAQKGTAMKSTFQEAWNLSPMRRKRARTCCAQDLVQGA